HEALPQQFHTVHLRFGTASSVVSAPVSPDRTAEIFRRPQGLVSGDCTSGDGLPRLRVLAGRDDGVGAAVGDRIMALAGIIGAVHCPAGDCAAICREGAVTLPISSPAGIWLSRSGRTGASPIWLPVTSTARISSVCSSIPRWILRQTRRLGPPCLRACHSPSPSTLMPVLSISRCSGPLEPRYGMLTARVFWRRL